MVLDSDRGRRWFSAAAKVKYSRPSVSLFYQLKQTNHWSGLILKCEGQLGKMFIENTWLQRQQNRKTERPQEIIHNQYIHIRWLHSVHRPWQTDRSRPPSFGVRSEEAWTQDTRQRNNMQAVKVEEKNRWAESLMSYKSHSSGQSCEHGDRAGEKGNKEVEAEMTNRSHRWCWSQSERKCKN